MFKFWPKTAVLTTAAITFSCGLIQENRADPVAKIEEEDPGQEPILTGEFPLMPRQSGGYYCPSGFIFMHEFNICLKGETVRGPFTLKMVENCKNSGKYTPEACDAVNWSISMVKEFRKEKLCMDGSWYDLKKGVCVDKENVYGPFTRALVDSCYEYGGDEVCETMRWGKSFIPNRPGKYYCPLGMFYDKRSQLCITEEEAWGPFTESMIEGCIDETGSETICRGNTWNAIYAQAWRGDGRCPKGSTYIQKKGYCVEGDSAFGPFEYDTVSKCFKYGGGRTCLTNRIHVNLIVDKKPKPTKGYTAPLDHRPTANPFTRPRHFGAGRSGGRKHAANDLYSYVGRDVYAIANGVVLDYYYFYSGTYALVVKHKINGQARIVRYGEVSGKPSSIRRGSRVKKGQRIAFIGKMKCCRPMLHFELFHGTRKGALTQRYNPPYQRRSDLLNPSQMVKEFYKIKGWRPQW